MLKLCLFTTLIALLSALAAHAEANVTQQADYGAGSANTRFMPVAKAETGKDDFNYLALRDHVGPSGVPLGGIGVGSFDFTPEGRFSRIGLHNIHEPMPAAAPGCFFSLWQNSNGRVSARRLVREDVEQCGMRGFKHSTYTGLFPRADISFDDEPGKPEPVQASVSAYSGLIPHNVKDSSLPVVWFDVKLTASADVEVSVALSWEDFLGRNLRDPKSIDGMAGQLMRGDVLDKANGELWPNIQRVPTAAKPCTIAKMQGVMQFTTEPWKPKKLTFQNYVTQIALLADPGRGGKLTILPAYKVDDGAPWNSFAANGEFAANAEQTALSDPDGPVMASGIAVKTKIKEGESRVIRFAIAWYYPVMDVDRKTADPASYWTTCDYGRWFHNYFGDIESLVTYAAKERKRILKETIEWQTPILRSTLPDWLKFKIINSAYTMYTNCTLNKAGDFMVNEGGMGGLAGTMDQRICAHPFYQKFFPQLDRSEMQLFADCQDPEGYILHFIGHYYVGMATKGSPCPTEKSYMLDNTGGWIIQLAKDAAQSGDMDYLKRNADRVRKAMVNLKAHIPKGRQIPVGSTTYDDYHHPPVDSYMAGLYLSILKAGISIGEMLGDKQMVDEYTRQYAKTQQDAVNALWNGRFFAHGCEEDGSNRRDDMMFTGQLAGEFVSRYCGWGAVFPLDMVRASLISQFKTSLSHYPDYYANKVWSISEKKGMDMEGSQCWPFYLEAYTGMMAIQAGYLDDGLDIMKHIQLVHLRKGFTWCQNLWNPDQYTYMTAPVTWFITDVLAGTNLDARNKTLHIAPVGPIEGDKLVMPIYFPNFWGVVSYQPAKKRASLRIIKTFGEKPVLINKLVSEPAGKPTSERKVTAISEFVVKKGATLDLSPYWEQISGAVRREAVLQRADAVEFLEVKP